MARPKGRRDYRGVNVAEIHRRIENRVAGLPDEIIDIPAWLNPPIELGKIGRKVWREAVRTRGPQWFAKSDLLLLREYALAAIDMEYARTALNKNPDDEKCAKRLTRTTIALMRMVRVLGLGVNARVAEAHRMRTITAKDTSTQQVDAAVTNIEADDSLRLPAITAAPSAPATSGEASVFNQLNRDPPWQR